MNVTVANNTANQSGGGIYSTGNGTTLLLIGATLHSNQGLVDAGGIFIDGQSSADIINSTVRDNTADSVGGINNQGELTVTGSTISGNAATDPTSIGGGLFNGMAGAADIVNTTISGNTAGGDSGGIKNGGSLTLSNVTLTDNTAPVGAGMVNNDSAIVKNSIIAENNGENCFGAVTSEGYNLENTNTCGLNGTGDLVNTSPLLDSLADNGGPTETHALLYGSPAVDGGNPGGCADQDGSPISTDQRGAARPLDGDGNGSAICDIGAFEAAAAGSPDISVTDSTSPNSDRRVEFGEVTVGFSSDQTVTVHNNGNAGLIMGSIGQANGLSAPFSIVNDTCSGQTVAPSGTCTAGVRFSPGSAGLFSNTFDIPSNDPDENPVTVTVRGTGSTDPIPDISVTDTIGDAQDLSLPFSELTEGNVADGTVTIANNGYGGADLVLGTIGQADPLASPFSIQNDLCSGQTLGPSETCSLDVRFSPTAAGSYSDAFDIPSNDPDEDPVTVSVSGDGLSSAANNPPSVFALISPANGETGLGSPVTFEWEEASDPDGNVINYRLTFCEESSFTGCDPFDVVVAQNDLKKFFANRSGWTTGLILIGAALMGGMNRRRRLALMMVVLMAGGVLTACGRNGGGGGGGGGVSLTAISGTSVEVTGLKPGTTYYWKVTADDGNGGMTDSEVRTFGTK